MREIDPNKLYAVVTGDIVASSRLTRARRTHLFEYMEMGFSALRDAFGKSTPMATDIASGDRWQMLLHAPRDALRLTLFYRAFLRAKMESHNFHSRAVIAIGHVTYVPRSGLTRGDGEAFQLSGRMLEKMRRHAPWEGTMRLEFPRFQRAEGLSVILSLLEEIASRWTDRQALAVTGALRGWKQDEIAAKWWGKKITQQAVAQHLARAGWYAVDRAVQHFEGTVGAAAGGDK